MRINSANFRLSRWVGSALWSLHNPPDMKTADTNIAALEAACAFAKSLDAVASAQVWTPTPEEIDDYAAGGIIACATLEVTVWRFSCASTVQSEIEALGVRCIGDGSGPEGPCLTFSVA